MSEWNRKLESNDLHRATGKEAAHAAMGVISANQHRPPEIQVMGAAMAFVAIMKKSNISPSDVFCRAERMLRLDEHASVEMRALRAYLQEEVFEAL